MFHKFHAPKQATPKFQLPNNQPLDYQTAGDELFSHGLINEAIIMYKQGIQYPMDDLKKAGLFYSLGFAYVEAWQRSNDAQYASFASTCFQKAINLSPSLECAYIDLGNLQRHFSGGDEFALEKYNDGLKMYPHMIGVLCSRGCTYLRLGKMQEGISDLVRVLSCSPASIWTQQATEALRKIDKRTILAQIKTFPPEEQKVVLAQICTQKTFLNKIFVASSGFLGWWKESDQSLLNDIHELNSKLNPKDQANSIDELDQEESAAKRYEML